MSKKLLYIIIGVLIIINIISFIILKKDNSRGKKDDLTNEEAKIMETDEVASVAGEKIMYDDWMKSLRNAHGKKHLEDMINEKIVQELAEEKDFYVSDKVIDREIAYLTTMSGIMSEEEIEKQEEEWEKELMHHYQLEALLTEDVNIPEDEVRSHYDENRNQYDFSASFQLSHIIVPDMDTAEKVIDELEEGAPFHLLAKEYSEDEETKEDGGYLGYFTTSSQFIPHGYDEIIQDMEEHSFSDPVSLGDEVTIVYLHRYLPEIKFSYDELKEHIERELAYEKIDRSAIMRKLWKEADVEWVYDES